MSHSRLPLLAATTLSLLVAAPALAVTGSGVSPALRSAPPLTLASTTSKASKSRTCQAGGHEKAGEKTTLLGSKHGSAVVACEQPPRSSLVTPLLKQATAAALATLG